MSKVFLIAGIGADTRIYRNIDLKRHEVICVDWIEPHVNDTLGTYAKKLISRYSITGGSIVIGNSLGAMIAVEIGKVLPLKQIIIISGIKSIEEAPPYFKFFRALPVYKLIPGKLIPMLGFMIQPVFGHMSAEDIWLFKDMLSKSSPLFLKWAMTAALRWDNTAILENIIHITGDKDRVFPLRYIRNAIVIIGGTHIMVYDRAKEINSILENKVK